MTGDKGNGERWLNIAGSLASLAALGYLLTHLPRRGERSTPVAGLPTKGRIDVRVTRKDRHSFRLDAFSDRKPVGQITVLADNGYGYPAVEYIRAAGSSAQEPVRGGRVGTRMYEAAARIACEEYGSPLASGFSRTDAAESFWFKQKQKGRAEERRHDAYSEEELAEDPDKRDTFYTLTCPAPTSLEGLPKRALSGVRERLVGPVKYKLRTSRGGSGFPYGFDWRAYQGGVLVGFLDAQAEGNDYHLNMVKVLKAARRKGVGSELLKRAVATSNKYGKKLFSSDFSDAGLALVESAAGAGVPIKREAYGKIVLGSLPTKGRIPVATAKRALNRLGRKAKACGITPALLREGMEVEREHRDVTGGRVGTTAKIAAAHICEDKQYYRKLKRYIEK